MKTTRIEKSEIANMPILATGYKAVKWDLSTNGNNKFRYGEIGEDIVGSVWKVDGDIAECKWGLHFSKDPAYVFNFYEPLGYNRYFKVNAYGKVVDAKDNMKSVATVIEFVEEYDLMTFIEIIKRFDRSNAVSNSYAVSDSNAVSYSSAVSDSNAVSYSSAVRGSNAVSYSNAVRGSNAVSYSNAVSCSNAVSDSNAVSYSNAVSDSYAVRGSYAVSYSNAVSDSSAVSDSNAVSYSYGIRKCEAVKNCIFCYNIEGRKSRIFNKTVTAKRFDEVYRKIIGFGWVPSFENWYDIKGNKEWWAFCFPQLKEVENAVAWGKMPGEMLEYIKSLPEYDEKIFAEITK